jgi:hypothetical protein
MGAGHSATGTGRCRVPPAISQQRRRTTPGSQVVSKSSVRPPAVAVA